MMRGGVWPPEMHERFLALVAEKELSGGRIAAVLNKEFAAEIALIGLIVNRNSIAGKVHKFGLSLAKSRHDRKKARRRKIAVWKLGEPEEHFPPVVGPAVEVARERYELTGCEHSRDVVKPPPKTGEAHFRDLPEEARTPHACTLLDLDVRSCRWPIRSRGGYLFCGAESVPLTPYCAAHLRRAGAVYIRRSGSFVLPGRAYP